jgi:hypothetical protein
VRPEQADEVGGRGNVQTRRCIVILLVPKDWRHMNRQNIMLISIRCGMLHMEKVFSRSFSSLTELGKGA